MNLFMFWRRASSAGSQGIPESACLGVKWSVTDSDSESRGNLKRPHWSHRQGPQDRLTDSAVAAAGPQDLKKIFDHSRQKKTIHCCSVGFYTPVS